MKIKFIFLLLCISFIYPLTAKNKELEIYSSEFFNSKISYAFDYIENKDYLNEYKKYLLKEKALLIYKSILLADADQRKKDLLSQDFKKISLCILYHFEMSANKEVEDLINILLVDDDFLIENFNKFGMKFYSESFATEVIDYAHQVKDSIGTMCTSPLSFNNINDE